MIRKQDLDHIDEFVWQLPRNFRVDMRVPARMYADELLVEDALADKSVEQLVNTATMPGIVNWAIAMPDIHQGYGAPIGAVFATRLADGVVSPGAIGYDINCGVRVLASQISAEEIRPYLDKLASALYENCPSGVGVEGSQPLTEKNLEHLLEEGAEWTRANRFASEADLNHTEEYGRIRLADASKVSSRAKSRGKDQLGTLGAGNHFIEVDRIAEIFEVEVAGILGLYPNQVVVQIHCGSRGLGHQVCTDYVNSFQRVIHEYNIQIPDRELVCAPFNSDHGQNYLKAMGCAANFAFANRQLLAFNIRKSFEQTLRRKVRDTRLRQVYDIAHNMGKVEEHLVDGVRLRVCVHRKGATRAFGPGSPVLPDDLRAIGQPVLIPGSMGTASYILVGTAGSMEQTFGSSCHGAGRVMSRAQAKRQVRGEKLRDQLAARGIVVRAGSMPGLAEEAPEAYKDVSRVVDVVHKAGIGNKVARLEPMAVVKG